MALLSWQSIIQRAGVALPVTVTLSPTTQMAILDLLAVASDRWRWGPVDDSTWDEIESAVANASDEVLSPMRHLGMYALAIAPVLPAGTLWCDGSTHQRIDYPEFYALLDSLSSPLILNADEFTVPDLDDEVIGWSGVGQVAFSWVVVVK